MLFEINREIEYIQGSIEKSSKLYGERGYIIETLGSNNGDGRIQSSAISEIIVDKILMRTSNIIIQLRRQQFVSSNLRATATPVFILLWDDRKLGTRVQRKTPFPVCSVINPTRELVDAKYVVFIRSNWRCIIKEISPSHDVLKNDRSETAVILPMSAITEITREEWKNEVEKLWMGDSKFINIAQLLNWLNQNKKAIYRLSLFNVEYTIDSSKLRYETKSWALFSLCLLGLSTVFYVHGTLPAMKNEMGIRLSLGIPYIKTVGWLFIDLATQIFVLISLSLSCALATSLIMQQGMSHDTIRLIIINILILMSMPFFITMLLLVFFQSKIISPASIIQK